jgi:hypothetical protein
MPIPHDRDKGPWRNLVERISSRWKSLARVTTRYAKTRESRLGWVAFASI